VTATATASTRRLLGVYAHPDDETFCTGATFARYAAAGCEIMVISATRGQAGQIRSGTVATRHTLAEVRERELRLACERLGVAHVQCWDYSDGALRDVDPSELEERIGQVIRTFRPEVVVSFGSDGAYGHPDHIAISQATTAACAHVWAAANGADEPAGDPARPDPPWLYHAVFPRRRLLLRDRLVKWLIVEGPDFKGDAEFMHGLLLLTEEASLLHRMEDYHEIKWFPADFAIIEQGEPATTLFLLLDGHADVVREAADGTRRFITRLEPGQFFGEQGIAHGAPRNAHVIAVEGATCLVFSPGQPTLFEGRGEGARLASTGSAELAEIDLTGATTRIEAGASLQAKLEAIAAYRTQFPFRPDMLPESIFSDLFGAEYFTQVLPRRSVETELGMLRARRV
jgi:LmbE family N-acetylglucosaminyl deacetylase